METPPDREPARAARWRSALMVALCIAAVPALGLLSLRAATALQSAEAPPAARTRALPPAGPVHHVSADLPAPADPPQRGGLPLRYVFPRDRALVYRVRYQLESTGRSAVRTATTYELALRHVQDWKDGRTLVRASTRPAQLDDAFLVAPDGAIAAVGEQPSRLIALPELPRKPASVGASWVTSPVALATPRGASTQFTHRLTNLAARVPGYPDPLAEVHGTLHLKGSTALTVEPASGATFWFDPRRGLLVRCEVTTALRAEGLSVFTRADMELVAAR